MIKNQIFILLYILVTIVKIDAQSLLYKIPLEEQINKASLIIEGKVVDKKAYLSSLNNHIYTINKIQVFRVFKGEEQSYINVVTKGGSINFKKEEVKPSLQLRKNTMGVFMLEENFNQFVNLNTSLKTYHTYSDLQGFYKYDEYKNLVMNPYYSFSGIQDTFYKRLTTSTNKNKELIDYSFSFKKQSKGFQSSNISSFTPQEVRSGTGQTITITGTNFGSTTGIIQFKNADNGGGSFDDAYNSAIQSWSNSSITLSVPSFAGTGKIQVITNEGNFLETDTDLTVLSAELNSEFDQFPEVDYRAKLYNSDRQGGYTWTYNRSFFQNSDAVAAFERSIDSWVCATNISWLVSGEQSSINGAESDGFNIVTFKSGFQDGSDEIGPGILAVTTTYYSGCENGNTVTSYVDEIDMTFNSDFNWYFGEGVPGDNENDFQGTATHELGHAHNLGHVIAPSNLMHFETDSGSDSATRLIDDDSVEGATISYAFSKTSGLCGQRIAEDRNCGDYSVQEIIENENLVSILNPIIDDLLIKVNEIGNLEYSFLLYDMSGALILSDTLLDLEESVNTSFLSSGIYIVKIIIGDKVHIQKVVKL